MKTILLTNMPVLMLIVPSVYAGGPAGDYDELKYKDLNEPGVFSCHRDGYNDGLNSPYDYDRSRECDFGDNKNAYYDGFITGCTDVEGNTRETCDRFTDE